MHLLVADDSVVPLHRFGPMVAVCGEVVTEPGATAGADPAYCDECVREALRWSLLAAARPGAVLTGIDQ